MPKEKTNRSVARRILATPSHLRRFYTKEGVHPFAEVEWKSAVVTVPGVTGMLEREVEVPASWSEHAVRIAAAKYFRGRIGTSEWESSVKQMISRVAGTIRDWGKKFGYFSSEEASSVFHDELTSILLHQRAAFNSPVWFNVGVMAEPQCSACFILSVEDNMDSILDWIKNEGLIFKRGSGAGINLSTLRAERETLSQGGHSSGPVSFMRGADSVAGMIASGGSTRRAAKMVVMNIDHPDIMQFVSSKAEEEKKIRAFIDAGYNMYDLNNEAWHSIQYQNANNSVRVTDEFMSAVERDESFSTKFIRNNDVAETHRAKDMMRSIAQAAWDCGDPGIQFDTIINRWHTCPVTGRINASNPCSEYMHLDDSACNLASINLMKYLGEDGSFDVDAFRHTVRIMILAQEIAVEGSSYPTKKITENARNFRQLGLGYANLGALLMKKGIAYDSEEGRHSAASITALMTGEAYRWSAVIAKEKGPFVGFDVNRKPMLRVLGMHRDALDQIRPERVFDRRVLSEAVEAWDEAVQFGGKYGVRNSQATVLAPTGTIALMMDCTTTGIEPEFALVKTKHLVGGGTMKFINSVVRDALVTLGYGEEERNAIVSYIEDKGVAEGAPYLKAEHLSVFDCAVRSQNGTRSIPWQGHVKMVAAAQPFLSGAVSKTFNMSAETTVEEIMEAYVSAWKLGLKAFAVYRDGSKAAQPLVTGNGGGTKRKKQEEPVRRRLSATRKSETHKFSIAGHEGYLTHSIFDNGDLAEIFIKMSKQGSTLAGLLDTFAIAVSIAIQYGVPLSTLVQKFSHGRYEPAGFTANPDIPVATSITDYIFRYLAVKFLTSTELEDLGISGTSQIKSDTTTKEEVEVELEKPAALPPKREASSGGVVYADSVCRACGGMLIQTGSCKTCIQCGTSNGGC
ncbi:MAG: vitamin B12-dependent ribonucleotide reductase [Patescibacteria group bacterium]